MSAPPEYSIDYLVVVGSQGLRFYLRCAPGTHHHRRMARVLIVLLVLVFVHRANAIYKITVRNLLGSFIAPGVGRVTRGRAGALCSGNWEETGIAFSTSVSRFRRVVPPVHYSTGITLRKLLTTECQFACVDAMPDWPCQILQSHLDLPGLYLFS